VATTEALTNAIAEIALNGGTNASTGVGRLLSTATVASATTGDLDVPAGYMDMSVFVVTDSQVSTGERNLFDNSIETTMYRDHKADPTDELMFLNIDRGENITIDGFETTPLKPVFEITDRTPLTICVFTRTDVLSDWTLAGEQSLGARGFETVEFVLPAPVTSRYFRLEFDDPPSNEFNQLTIFAFRRSSYVSSYRVLDNPTNPFDGGTASAFQVGSSSAYPNTSEAVINLGGTRQLTKQVAYASASPEMIPTRYSVWSGPSGTGPWTPINLSTSPPFTNASGQMVSPDIRAMP
jgi:hypothetical protein